MWQSLLPLATGAIQGGGSPSLSGRPSTATADSEVRGSSTVSLSGIGNVSFGSKSDTWLWALLGVSLAAVALVAVRSNKKG